MVQGNFTQTPKTHPQSSFYSKRATSFSFTMMPGLTPACTHVRQSQNWNGLFFPNDSPDLVHSNYHLFGPVKDALCVCHFADDNKLKQSSCDVLQSRSREFYNSGTQRLTQRWQKVVENEEDFVK
jgi:hypothetical protein